MARVTTAAMADKINPIRDTNAEAQELGRTLIARARYGALGVLDPETGAPMVTRIAVVPGPKGMPITLISDLSGHATALKAQAHCSLLLGEPGPKGDPLTHPRITLQCQAGVTDKMALKSHYLRLYPKAKLYYDFADFRMYEMRVERAMLNGGFGKAYVLTPSDLGL